MARFAPVCSTTGAGTLGAWAEGVGCTSAALGRAIRLRASCTPSCAITSRPSARRRPSLRDGEGLPRFVEAEFRSFLRLRLARRRVRAVPLRMRPPPIDWSRFPAKAEGMSELRRPSDGGTGGYFVDHVLPDVPVRQWVWSLPYRLSVRAGVGPLLVSRGRRRAFRRPNGAWLSAHARPAFGVSSDGRSSPVAVAPTVRRCPEFEDVQCAW